MWVAIVTRSRSEVIRTTRNHGRSCNRLEEISAGRVVCFITIHDIDVNTCTHNLVQRVVSSEDDARLRCSTRNVVEHCDLVRFGGGEILSLTTVNMTNMRPCARDLFHELTAKLVCKENTWRNNYDGFRTTLESVDCINNHAESLTTTGWNKDTTLVDFLHLGYDAGLVGTKNHAVRLSM